MIGVGFKPPTEKKRTVNPEFSSRNINNLFKTKAIGRCCQECKNDHSIVDTSVDVVDVFKWS